MTAVTTDKQSPLLPCPFCGAAMALRGDYTHEAAWNFYTHADREQRDTCILSQYEIPCGLDYQTPVKALGDAWNRRAALAAAPALGQWQPISSAPKDGTRIDLWANGRRYSDCSWGRFDEDSSAPFGGYHWRGVSQDIPPTHWMPLPAAPALMDDKQRGED